MTTAKTRSFVVSLALAGTALACDRGTERAEAGNPSEESVVHPDAASARTMWRVVAGCSGCSPRVEVQMQVGGDQSPELRGILILETLSLATRPAGYQLDSLLLLQVCRPGSLRVGSATVAYGGIATCDLLLGMTEVEIVSLVDRIVTLFAAEAPEHTAAHSCVQGDFDLLIDRRRGRERHVRYFPCPVGTDSAAQLARDIAALTGIGVQHTILLR